MPVLNSPGLDMGNAGLTGLLKPLDRGACSHRIEVESRGTTRFNVKAANGPEPGTLFL
jgi:hypothetical protein